jgi:hypothetical protein
VSAIDLHVMRAVLERRRSRASAIVAPEQPASFDADAIVRELRDLKAVLERHHALRPIPSGG